MSCGNTSTIVEECRVINNPLVGRRRRHAMANIFSGIDRVVMERNGWGSYGNDSSADSDNGLSETKDTSRPDSLTLNSNSEERSEDTEHSSSMLSEHLNFINSNSGSDIELERNLDDSITNSCEESTSEEIRRVEGSVSVGSLYQLWAQMDRRRRRNASPHVLDSISNSQLEVLKDLFVSTVHGNTNTHRPTPWLMCN